MPVFRTEGNALITRGLFLEPNWGRPNVKPEYQIYTLDTKDKDGYISVYRVYMELMDPTEYKIATELFEGPHHWQRICECEWFQPFLEAMRRDLRSKIKSLAVEQIINEANDENSKNRFAALKYLADGGYIEKKAKAPVGRPNKPKKPVAEDSEYQKEFNRIFGNTAQDDIKQEIMN